jgi:hypothetical protein
MKLMTLAIGFALFAGAAMAEQYTGWIGDADCVKTAKFDGDVQITCVASGAPLVFVNEADKKIYVIANPDKAKELIGKKVRLTGDLKDDKVVTETIVIFTPEKQQ